MVSGLAISASVADLGPFSLHSKNDNLILLQTFLGVVSLTSLILAAVTAERFRASRALQRRADDLTTLNESSRVFLNASNPATLYQTICELAASRIGLDAAWIERKAIVGEQPDPLASCGITNAEIKQLDLSSFMLAHSEDPEQIHVFTLDGAVPIGSSPKTPFKSLAVVPLIFSGALIGHLKLLSRESQFFSTDRQLLLRSYANLA